MVNLGSKCPACNSRLNLASPGGVHYPVPLIEPFIHAPMFEISGNLLNITKSHITAAGKWIHELDINILKLVN